MACENDRVVARIRGGEFVNERATTTRHVQFWTPIALFSAGILLLLVRSWLPVPVLRDGFLALAYGSFTLALFEGVESMRSAVTGWQRRG